MLADQNSSRSRILDAALECIGSRGFAAASMRTLANLVGIQPGSIYHHFNSKQELLSELLFQQQQKRLESVRTAGLGKFPVSALFSMSEALWRDARRDVGHLSLRREARHLEASDQLTYVLRENLLIVSFEQVLISGSKQGSFFLNDTLTIARALVAIIEDSASRPDSSLPSVWLMVQRMAGSAALSNGE